ncbi:MAG: flagellar basal body rod protein FlgC [Bacillota bacterium]
MSLFRSLITGASGLTAQRLRMDVISNNLANINTTRTENGEAYRRQVVLFAERQPALEEAMQSADGSPMRVGRGVRVTAIAPDQSDFRRVYEPGHPDADQDGYVNYPNVNPVTEMVDMISASRAYEANVTVVNAAKSMAAKALEIGR